MTLTPAYGRDYKNKKDAIADFEANKDFVIADISSPYDGKYVNKADLVSSDVTCVYIRYDRLMKLVRIAI